MDDPTSFHGAQFYNPLAYGLDNNEMPPLGQCNSHLPLDNLDDPLGHNFTHGVQDFEITNMDINEF